MNRAASGADLDGRPDGEQAAVAVAGIALVADADGALYWPEQHLLVVADLHLEKGSSYAVRGVLLPPYDTAATLAALARVVVRYRPRIVVALGDSFHDGDGPQRLSALSFRHQPAAGAADGEIAGHLHPMARVATRGGSVRRRCFAADGRRMVMPAFGAYAGGLNVRDAAIAGLFGAGFTAHMLGAGRLHAFAGTHCLAD